MSVVKIGSEMALELVKNEIEGNGSEMRVVGIGKNPIFFKEYELDKLINLIKETDTIRNRYIDTDDRIMIIGYEFHAPIQIEAL